MTMEGKSAQSSATERQPPNLEELQLNLRHQLTLYRQLVDLLREEKEHLIGARLKEIREATYSKEAIFDEIHREEFRRQRWVKQAAAFLGVQEKEITLELVAGKIWPDQFEPLISLRNTMLHMVKKAREMNLDNKRLVEQALLDTQEMKRNVLGLSSEQPQVYGPKGAMGNNPRDSSARFLNKDL
jgi:flagellar biosynthesis/type III secretory pathway chaperone